MVVKPTRTAHYGIVDNRISFDEAYEAASLESENVYYTPGNRAPFRVRASITTRGTHKGERVIIFKTEGREMARSYPCCWGHVTNCNRTYIDCYTSVL